MTGRQSYRCWGFLLVEPLSHTTLGQLPLPPFRDASWEKKGTRSPKREEVGRLAMVFGKGISALPQVL